ncbi:MAG: sel1 repeat family protein, partial [Xanthomonadales bacterium]|nr:sel1 repeat family protein [Xanthomonadales bacterium]NIX12692.1 sel1 repeat family protein [Xanthomonadales bacterium]
MAATSAGDYEAALEEFRPLAEEGDPVAQNALGVFYTHGLGVPVDPRQGVEWFLQSA